MKQDLDFDADDNKHRALGVLHALAYLDLTLILVKWIILVTILQKEKQTEGRVACRALYHQWYNV